MVVEVNSQTVIMDETSWRFQSNLIHLPALFLCYLDDYLFYSDPISAGKTFSFFFRSRIFLSHPDSVQCPDQVFGELQHIRRA